MRNEPLDLENLLHPSRAYAHPRDVLRDSDLTLYEKRAILASWASDACAVDPCLRQLEPGRSPVSFDEVMDALRTLDALPAEPHRARKVRAGQPGEGHRHL
jgi:hypothetical protein